MPGRGNPNNQGGTPGNSGAKKNQLNLENGDLSGYQVGELTLLDDQDLKNFKKKIVIGTDGSTTLTNTVDDTDTQTGSDLDDLIDDVADELEDYESADVRAAMESIGLIETGEDLDGSGDDNDEQATIGDVVDLGAGNDQMWAGDGNDIVLGNEGNDNIRGENGNDMLFGEEGNDVLEGGDGEDVARFGGDEADNTIGFFIDDDYNFWWQVTGPDGTDKVRNVEEFLFDDGSFTPSTEPVLLFDDNGEFVSGHGTIQNAVDAASASYTAIIMPGTYAESVNVDVPMSFIGSGAGSTVIDPASGNGFTIADLSGFGTDGDVSFAGLTVEGAENAYGIVVPAANGMDTLSVVDSDISDNGFNGLAVFGDNVANVVVENTTFSSNGGDSGGSGDGDVLFYQYEGDASLTDVTITGDNSGENGIQFRDDDGAMGDVSLTNVTISGTYQKTGLAIYNYSDISGLSIDGMVITASTGWDLAVNFDGIGGTIDYSALDIDTSGSEGIVSLQGDDGDNTIITGDIDSGNTDVDGIAGVPLDAFLRGYDGDDTFVLGSGVEFVDGGNFTEAVGDLGDGDTVDYSSSAAGVTVDLGSTGPQSGGDAQNDVLLGIENVIGSDSADTLTGTAEANVIEGRAGNDTIDLGSDAGSSDTLFDRDDAEDTVVAADTFANNGTDTVTNYGDGGNGSTQDTIDLSDSFDFSADPSTLTGAQLQAELTAAFTVNFDGPNGGAGITDGTDVWFHLHENSTGDNTPENVQVEVDGYLFDWNFFDGDTEWDLIGPA